jgi:hypothetical protein
MIMIIKSYFYEIFKIKTKTKNFIYFKLFKKKIELLNLNVSFLLYNPLRKFVIILNLCINKIESK